MRHLSHAEEETELATLGHFSDDYGDEPIFKCQNCASKNPGYEEKEASLLTIIAAILCLIIFRLYSFLILPLVVESTKTIIKKCVKCDHILDKQELLSMPSLTDKILSFKCGSCAMVISRKYALVIIAILSVIWFFIPSSSTTVVNPGGLNLTNLRWEEFVEDCGRRVVLSNQVRAKRSFDNKYANNYVEWTGVVHGMVSKKDIQNPFIGAIVLIKMNPSDSKGEYSDIQLHFTNNLASRYAETLRIMEKGDVLKFKGILRTMGDEFHYHDLEAQTIELTGSKMNIDDIPMISYTPTNMRKGRVEGTDSQDKTDRPLPDQKTAQTPKPADENTDKTETTQTPQSTDSEPVQSNDQNTPADDQADDQAAAINDQTAAVDDQTAEPNQTNDEPNQNNDEPGQGDDEPNQNNDEPDQTNDEPNQNNDEPDQTNDEPNQNNDEPDQTNDQDSVIDQSLQADDEPGQVDAPSVDDQAVQDNNQDISAVDQPIGDDDQGNNPAGDT